MSLIKVEKLSKSFGNKKIFKDISLEIDENQIYGIIGMTGVGKTTLFHLLLGQERIDEGKIVINEKDIEKGSGVSYGHTFVAPKKMKVVTIPIGYNDGYLRAFSNKAAVLINEHICPVIGNVTMDQIMVDASKVKEISLGTPVTIMGEDHEREVSAEDLAKCAETINYEIVCGFGNRLPRVYS